MKLPVKEENVRHFKSAALDIYTVVFHIWCGSLPAYDVQKCKGKLKIWVKEMVLKDPLLDSCLSLSAIQ